MPSQYGAIYTVGTPCHSTKLACVLDTLAAGTSVEELLGDFPYLSRDDVLACLAYAARAVDHSVVQAAA